MKLPFEDVAKPTGVNNLDKYSDGDYTYRQDGCPMHVRAALLYNRVLREKGLDKHYEIIQDGEKIRYCYLKLPNPIQENVIAAMSFLPEELGLAPYLDRSTQFEKTFLEPLKTILHAAGWDTEERSTLEGLFE